jgi:hypothetical protein
MNPKWGKHWTAKEVILLKEWQEQGVPGKEQAKRLGRSYYSWHGAIVRYKLMGERHSNYNPDIRAMVMRLLPQGYMQKDIAKMRGVVHTSICRVTKELVKKGLLVETKRGKYIATDKWGGDHDPPQFYKEKSNGI